jgi:hypothetical protein
MVEDNINHAPLDPEGMLKLFITESGDWTDPVTKNTLLCPLVVILYAGALRWVGM